MERPTVIDQTGVPTGTFPKNVFVIDNDKAWRYHQVIITFV